MRKVVLFSVLLVMMLVTWHMACADDAFYVIPTMREKYAPTPKTGEELNAIPGSDGAWKKGVAWPTPRFIDNRNGTVTDRLTGLIWLKNTNAFGLRTWNQAMSDASGLKEGTAGLTDGSKAGEWRLPNVRELQSLIDYGRYNPALPKGHPFPSLPTEYPGPQYWSSTTFDFYADPGAWIVYFLNGHAGSWRQNWTSYVWCVRGGP